MSEEKQVSEQTYGEVVAFLLKEAELLDEGRYQDWLQLLTEDVNYQMPVRVTPERGQGNGIIHNIGYLNENRGSLEMRIRRMETAYAWAENPSSRTRHFVSNIRVEAGDHEDEVKVRSYLLLYRSRQDRPDFELLSGERQDILRRIEGTWKLARRTIIVDQTCLNVANLSNFY